MRLGPSLQRYQLAGLGRRIGGGPATLRDALDLGLVVHVPMHGGAVVWVVGARDGWAAIHAYPNHPPGARCVGALPGGEPLPAPSGVLVDEGHPAAIVRVAQGACDPLTLGVSVARAFWKRRRAA
jgi:hypothetical protein